MSSQADTITVPLAGETFGTPAFLRLAFRPFFFAALLYGIVSVALWSWQYRFGWPTTFGHLSLAQWHAHEMIFGYALAVISGFMLTAVQTWTGQRALHGRPLLLLFLLWLVPRVGSVILADWVLWLCLVSSLLFYPLLLYAFLQPMRRAGDKRQWALQGKVCTLWVVESLFLLAALGMLNPGWISPILLAGLYMVVGLILMMAQRVVPFFIERALPEARRIARPRWLSVTMLLLFFVFIISDVLGYTQPTLISGLALAAAGAGKLFLWHRLGLWSRPLLWVLFIAYAFIVLGILFRALAPQLGISSLSALHLMSYGGIGMMTLGMIARTGLGHTGRDVYAPPLVLLPAFLALAVGTIIRCFAPLLWIHAYPAFVLASQLLWILAFMLVLGAYAKPLLTARIDGQDG